MKINGDIQVVGKYLDLKPEVLTEDPALESLSEPRLWVRDGIARFFNGTDIIPLREGTVTDAQLDAKLADYLKSADLDLTNYNTKTEVDQKISDATASLVSSTALATQLEAYETVAAFDAKIADYSTTTQTEAEIQNAVQNLVSNSNMQQAIDNAIAGLDFQADVLGLETDFVSGTSAAGRYVYLTGSTFTGEAEAGDIVDVDVSGAITKLDYDVSDKGPGVLSWNRATSTWIRFNGTDWAEFGGLAGVTVGNGLDKVGDTISLVLDGSSLVVSANGIKVGDLSATYATVNALQQAIANFVTASQVGTQIADALTNYTTTADLNTKLADYAKTADVNTKLADYAKTADVAATYETQQHASDTYATKTSLAPYAKTADVDTKLADYARTSDVSAQFADYTTTSDLNDRFADYSTNDELDTKLADYAKTADVDATLADYAKTADVAATYETAQHAADTYETKTDVAATYATKTSVSDNATRVTNSYFQYTSPAAATSHTVTHNIGNRFPIVQVADADTGELIIPGSVVFTDTTKLTVTFSTAVKVVVSVSWLKAAA